HQLCGCESFQPANGFGCRAAIWARSDRRNVLLCRRRQHLEHRTLGVRGYGNVRGFCLVQRGFRGSRISVSRRDGEWGLRIDECNELLAHILPAVWRTSHIECGPHRSWNLPTVCNRQYGVCLDLGFLQRIKHEPWRSEEHTSELQSRGHL